MPIKNDDIFYDCGCYHILTIINFFSNAYEWEVPGCECANTKHHVEFV